MKPCIKCKNVKPLEMFYKHKQMSDGHVNKCKECTKEDVRENRRKKIDYYTEYEKSRAMLPHRVKCRSEYQKTEAGQEAIKRAHEKYVSNNPQKRRAHVLLGNAVRDGRVTKRYSCEECGAGGRIHGHHDDYSKPLEVRWLCPSCHKKWHDENGDALNG